MGYGSFKVIENGTNLTAVVCHVVAPYGFLFAFHINCGRIFSWVDENTQT